MADVNEGPVSIRLETSPLAENAAGAGLGRLSVSDPDAGDSHSLSVSDPRFEVVEGQLQLKPGVALDHEAEPRISLEVTATDAAGAEISQSFEIEVADAAEVTVDTGFHASYFEFDHVLGKLDDVEWSAKPAHEDLVETINYTNSRDSFWDGGDTDTFGVRVVGNVEVEEGGDFKFFLGGDDGAALYVDGVAVITNDGLHSYQTKTGEIELDPGTHTIEVRYFENTGHAGLKLEWEGPGTDGREVVAAETDLVIEENGILTVGIVLEGAQNLDSVHISGLPADTILMSGDDVMVADGTDMDLTGWDLSMLEIAPPPGFVGAIEGEISLTSTTFNGQQVESASRFAIEVGDAGSAGTSTHEPDIGDIFFDSPDGGESGSWFEAPASNDADDIEGDQDDEVLGEEIVAAPETVDSFDVTETYERQDW